MKRILMLSFALSAMSGSAYAKPLNDPKFLDVIEPHLINLEKANHAKDQKAYAKEIEGLRKAICDPNAADLLLTVHRDKGEFCAYPSKKDLEEVEPKGIEVTYLTNLAQCWQLKKFKDTPCAKKLREPRSLEVIAKGLFGNVQERNEHLEHIKKLAHPAGEATLFQPPQAAPTESPVEQAS